MKGRRSEYLKHKEHTRALVHARIAYFVSLGEQAPKAVRIRNSKTRWGSCSRQGNVNFHYKLAFLPQELVDYVVVHELSHLHELNHSKRFWDRVAVHVPDHASKRKALNAHARLLR